MLINPLSLVFTLIAGVLMISGPFLAYFNAELWAVPMLFGLVLLVIAGVMQDNTEVRHAKKD